MAPGGLLYSVGALLMLVLFGLPAGAADGYFTTASDCWGNDALIAAFVALLPSSIAAHASDTNAYAEAGIPQSRHLLDDDPKFAENFARVPSGTVIQARLNHLQKTGGMK